MSTDRPPSVVQRFNLSAWAPLIITILGWVFFGGRTMERVDMNQNINKEQAQSITVQTKAINDLQNEMVGVKQEISSYGARIDRVEGLVIELSDIKGDVKIIRNDQGHIQNGLNRLEGEVKDIRRAQYNLPPNEG